MYSHVASLYSSLRIPVALMVFFALLPLVDVSLLMGGRAQRSSSRSY